MPGGKVEEGETYRQAAIRECLEETGITVSKAKLVFHGFSTWQNESYCYCYESLMANQLSGCVGHDLGSGKVVVRHYSVFLKSRYGAFYDAVFQTLGMIE